MQTAHTHTTIFQLNDQAITVSFGGTINPGVNNKVIFFNQLLLRQPFKGLVETIPAYCTLTVVYEAVLVKTTCAAGQTAAAKVRLQLEQLLNTLETGEPVPGALVRIPVCYHPDFAPDQHSLCQAKNITADEIRALHTASPFQVYMIGFMPGFPYMGIVPDTLQVPRLPVPRTHVPAGSVGIAGPQTGIYPFASPGGWHIIGQTPLAIFDAKRPQPCLLQPGNRVQFYAIERDEFEHIKQQLK